MDKFRIQLPKDLYDEIKTAAAARFMTPAALVGLAVYELTKGRTAPKPEKPAAPKSERPRDKLLTAVSNWKDDGDPDDWRTWAGPNT